MKPNFMMAVGCALLGFAVLAKAQQAPLRNGSYIAVEHITGHHDPAAPLAHFALASDGRAFYVASSGADSSPGLSQKLPLRTIQHAAQLTKPGDTVVVAAGTYDERIAINVSGDPGHPIRLVAARGEPVIVQGFEIRGNYVEVDGFEITNHNATQEHGVGVYLTGSHDVVSHNRIHDLCFEGVYVADDGRSSSATSANIISRNTIVRAEMSGAQVGGTRNLVEYNDVADTRQYPPGCDRRGRADADGFRFFGRGHVFRGNRIHDIAVPGSQYNSDPHTDCFQTWGPAADMIFDSNWCRMPAPSVVSSTVSNHIGMVEDKSGPVMNLLFIGNFFANLGQGLIVYGGAGDGIAGLRFLNNTVVNVQQEALILRHTPRAQIVNNIFYDVGGHKDSFLAVDVASADFVASNNDMYMSDGAAPGSYGSSVGHLTVDPRFVDPSALDFRLQPSSPLIGAGLRLGGYAGPDGPQPRPIDIGALPSR
jgi:hypothetical protein